jgi:CRP-like cAMP-binding protein
MSYASAQTVVREPVYNCGVASASVDILQKVPLFSGLDEKELEDIAEMMRERRFAAGETVTKEGAVGAGFFIVEDGGADVTVNGAPVGSIGPGDYFGEVALLTGSDRTATIVATTDMLCYGMTPWDFRPLVESNSALGLKLRTAMAERKSSSSP